VFARLPDFSSKRASRLPRAQAPCRVRRSSPQGCVGRVTAATTLLNCRAGTEVNRLVGDGLANSRRLRCLAYWYIPTMIIS
jgi:hypothetical protein